MATLKPGMDIEEVASQKLASKGLLGTSSFGSQLLQNAGEAKQFSANQQQLSALSAEAADALKAATAYRRGAEDSVFGGDYASKANMYEDKYKKITATMNSLASTNAVMQDNPLLAGVSGEAIQQNKKVLNTLEEGGKNISSGNTVWGRTITPLLEGVALQGLGGFGGILKTIGEATGLGNAVTAASSAVQPAVNAVADFAKPVTDAVSGATAAAPGPIATMIENLAKRVSYLPVEDMLTRIAFGEDAKTVVKEGLTQARESQAFEAAKLANPNVATKQTIKNPITGETIEINNEPTTETEELGIQAPLEKKDLATLTKDGAVVRSATPDKIEKYPGAIRNKMVGIKGDVLIIYPEGKEYKPKEFTTFEPRTPDMERGEVPGWKRDAKGIIQQGAIVTKKQEYWSAKNTGATFIRTPYDADRVLLPTQSWGRERETGQVGIITQKPRQSGGGGGGVSSKISITNWGSPKANELATFIDKGIADKKIKTKQELVKILRAKAKKLEAENGGISVAPYAVTQKMISHFSELLNKKTLLEQVTEGLEAAKAAKEGK